MLSKKKVYKSKGWDINPSVEQFTKTLGRSFNPRAYKELSVNLMGDALKYFFVLLLVCFIVAIILFVPKMFSLSDYISGQLQTFDKVSLDYGFESSEPVSFGDKNAVVVFSPDNKSEGFGEDAEDALVVISGDKMYYKGIFGFNEYNLEVFKDPKTRSVIVGSFLAKLFILFSPLIVLLSFIFYAIKYLVLVLLGAFVILVVSRLVRFEISLRELFNIGIYAATPMIILEIVTMPISSVNLPYIPFVLFLLYFILGTVVVGGFQEGHHPRGGGRKPKKVRSHRGYVDVHRIH